VLLKNAKNPQIIATIVKGIIATTWPIKANDVATPEATSRYTRPETRKKWYVPTNPGAEGSRA
jgi:hypothetical protein